MNADVKQEWVAALRSRRYPKGLGVLRDDRNTYCCLGVLCELAVQHGVISPPTVTDDGDCYLYDDSAGYLPDAVARWSGVSATGDIGLTVRLRDYTTNSLAALNDEGTFSFDDIADIIEENL